MKKILGELKNNTKLAIFSASMLFCLTCFPSVSNAQSTFSFGPTGAAPVTIPGSNDGTGSAITYTSSLISGGNASAATHDTPGSGSLPGTTGHSTGGGATPYTGTFFDPAVDGDASLVTSIQSTTRGDIDQNIAADYANYIGIEVNFSAPISLDAFGFIDLDGSNPEQNEWVGAFGTLNGATVIPTITLGDSANQGQRPASTNVDWSAIAGAPTNYGVAFNSNATAGEAPDSPSTQVSFDYGGAFVDNLYFVWGLEGDGGNANGNNNSGVTGFIVDETAVVPEPSSAVLFGFGFLAFLSRRKRAQ